MLVKQGQHTHRNPSLGTGEALDMDNSAIVMHHYVH